MHRSLSPSLAPPPPLLLAPMEGLLDFVLRDILTRIGGVDRCVSEFIRITDSLLPDRVFFRTMPELHHGSRTLAGVAVWAQLLGCDAANMAHNAARLAQLGALGIDLNFGCPARTVNRHGGGAALLRHPRQIANIVTAVRQAVPTSVPVSAKMRLGYDHPHAALECAQAMQEGGVSEIVVHARTKTDGYRPPAYWELLAPLQEALRVPVIANGEVWSVHDALRCRDISGCKALMLGRGMVADPGLARALRAHDAGGDALDASNALPWAALVPHLQQFWTRVCTDLEPRQRAGRLKQWLHWLRRRYAPAQAAFEYLRPLTDQHHISAWVQEELIATTTTP